MPRVVYASSPSAARAGAPPRGVDRADAREGMPERHRYILLFAALAASLLLTCVFLGTAALYLSSTKIVHAHHTPTDVRSRSFLAIPPPDYSGQTSTVIPPTGEARYDTAEQGTIPEFFDPYLRSLNEQSLTGPPMPIDTHILDQSAGTPHLDSFGLSAIQGSDSALNSTQLPHPAPGTTPSIAKPKSILRKDPQEFSVRTGDEGPVDPDKVVGLNSKGHRVVFTGLPKDKNEE